MTVFAFCASFVCRNVVIPRPDKSGAEVPGLGDIFVEFGDVKGAAAAIKGLAGRTFGGNIVKARYYPLQHYTDKRYGTTEEEVEQERLANTMAASYSGNRDLGDMPDFDNIDLDETSSKPASAPSRNNGSSNFTQFGVIDDAYDPFTAGDDVD
eukprot:TRINITY_DN327_c0_g1_i2.p1 TRINITY_DN327_c0_g1~~TRINITY_DN327_c0_g1_i2.p1  ORF type:complete len:153 (+),score=57.58 TRINITY_DN327_c0_g1_i2:863-1321(+)